MKTIKYICILTLFLTMGSCKKFLDEKPVAQVKISDFYRSKFDIDAATAGMYSSFQQTMVGEGQYLDRYHYWGDFRSDNFDRFLSYTTTHVTEIAMNAITPDNNFADWSRLYTVIARANSNIKYIPGVQSLDQNVTPAVVNANLMQSYAMRAMCYFYIIRVWGDAPIWLEPYEDVQVNAERPRESAAKILDEVVIKDLTTAYGLAVKNQTAAVYSINEGAICAALADAYMWKKDYANAIIWIKNLFKAKSPKGIVYAGTSDANLEPTATWKNIFTSPTTSPETIWSLHWDFVANGCACNVISFTQNNKTFQVDPLLYTKYFFPHSQAVRPNTDIRPKQTLDLYTVANPANNNRDRFVKWYASPTNPTAATSTAELNQFYTQQAPVYLTMYRLSDMYLLYAEALNGSNDLPNALRYLNFIRKRATLTEYLATDPKVSTKEAMENAILEERQYELIGEGKRWFDLVRTNKVKEIMDPVLKDRQARNGNTDLAGFGDIRRTLWPISRAVMNSNKKLVQNPGYGE
ncbi:RagB/SusD family nutrient uptake outer membrane protein [Pedobacter frigiditerrae]|uniref:RagB/SusD family nutrient uptake outer membrane protein n=1 Tax=Pedobacter frigiditerrae TaxID=2530452 RepID=A0A4R0MQG0_9SPHI|nr:RagB/SusD family nutrient uptake outer membrane protein [Pedobacter frigiditerrae]TCC89088.1 RagB/SusD family nutrient uptake outer membrane protein [Pedobacter frigiditerrae]